MLKKSVLSNTGHRNVLLLSTHAGRKPLSFQLFTDVFNDKSLCYFPYEVIYSNQVTAPEYVFLISELAGEQRFASIVAKRLESLVRCFKRSDPSFEKMQVRFLFLKSRI